MTNLNRIANTLFSNHGKPIPFTEIQKMLCEKNNKVWTRGWYCSYFSMPNGYGKPRWQQDQVLWKRAYNDGKLLGWVLTLKGHKYVTIS